MESGLHPVSAAPLYDIRGARRTYGSGETLVAALDGVDLRIDHGEFVVVAGPSGSGKTTLLQLLGALDRPTEGEVLFEGEDLAGMSDAQLTQLRQRTLGFVFQQFNLIPTMTARQNVEAALAPTGMGRRERADRTGELLERVKLGHRLDNLPSQLSGGEQQRVAIARALANRPRVVLADEPTGNLDSTTGDELMALLHTLSAEEGLSVVVVTHDASIAGSADRVVRMHDGRLVAEGEEALMRASAP
ncbi:MAG: putative transport system ATP-binding protein [Solirubrobacteraceae bacterium]|jgi:putative ABC transport system ATP-binding protein|nr:putative transport system ATP-binding protein [Solirubrobacteraceae bacterium]